MSLVQWIKSTVANAGHYEVIDSKINRHGNKTFDPNEPTPELTSEQLQLLRDTWQHVQRDVASVGVITFVSLFDTHPEVHAAFMSYRAQNATEQEYNAILRKHALRVMGTVDKCISRLHQPDKLGDLMTELGIRHKQYNVKIEYLDLMGPQFISSIKPHLADMWTPEHEAAWEQLFRLICHYMRRGMCSI